MTIYLLPFMLLLPSCDMKYERMPTRVSKEVTHPTWEDVMIEEMQSTRKEWYLVIGWSSKKGSIQ